MVHKHLFPSKKKPKRLLKSADDQSNPTPLIFAKANCQATVLPFWFSLSVSTVWRLTSCPLAILRLVNGYELSKRSDSLVVWQFYREEVELWPHHLIFEDCEQSASDNWREGEASLKGTNSAWGKRVQGIEIKGLLLNSAVILIHNVISCSLIQVRFKEGPLSDTKYSQSMLNYHLWKVRNCQRNLEVHRDEILSLFPVMITAIVSVTHFL